MFPHIMNALGMVIPSSEATDEAELPGIELDPGFSHAEFDFSEVGVAGWILALVLLAVVVIVAVPIVVYSIVTAKKGIGEKFTFTTKDLVYGAVCLAMSYVLSLFGLSLNLGGTITLASILPVAVYCYYFGFRKGLIVCTVFMLLQLTQGPYIVSPWSMLLDYVIPYLALCFTGAFGWMRKKHRAATGSKRFALVSNSGFYIGMAAYIVVRYISHILSGILFWDLWYPAAPLGFIVGYSCGYNSFCIIDCLIAFAVSLALLSSKNFDKLMTGVMFDAKKRGRNNGSAAYADSADNAGNGMTKGAEGSKQSADGSVTAQSDGLANTDPSAKYDERT